MTSEKRLRLTSSLLLLTSFVACTPLAQPTSAASTLVKGYGISPQGFPADYSHFPDFLQEVGSLPHGGVMFNGAWLDLTGQQAPGALPAVAVTVVEQAGQFSYTPIIVFGWRSEETIHLSVPKNPAANWTNAEAKALFKQCWLISPPTSTRLISSLAMRMKLITSATVKITPAGWHFITRLMPPSKWFRPRPRSALF